MAKGRGQRGDREGTGREQREGDREGTESERGQRRVVTAACIYGFQGVPEIGDREFLVGGGCLLSALLSMAPAPVG